MTTIDQLDIGIYVQYARRTQLIEQINQQYHLDEASSIPPQILLVDIYPKLSEMDLLLGIVPIQTPWAYFFPPPRFRFQRRSPFGFFRVAPSLGSFEKEDEDERKLEEVECETEEDLKEKKAIKSCFDQIDKINNWLSFIVGRVGQFLQG
ncbi:Uncharacterized protein PRO82_001709 [Candidatus Protochlamydia amoebophila]|jgi:hypothetical protein|uniref:Uncharacterized protein n=2 Tax=Candidatus Protochlamydia amoebophila TaxID=362787 RepID=Q6MEG5_PARUW|nr:MULTISPECIES: DUF5399 domain-containing protein [Protochlamydia]MBS4164381.1 Uncharacterized protein [Candidatus Protochlamydia amoebophila]CAF23034.1 unnamed protein product [Candidatus Protochlamydia amoebophila UWE25]